MKSEGGEKTRRSRNKREGKGGKKSENSFVKERKIFVEMVDFLALVHNHEFIRIVVYSEYRIHRQNFSNFSLIIFDVY